MAEHEILSRFVSSTAERQTPLIRPTPRRNGNPQKIPEGTALGFALSLSQSLALYEAGALMAAIESGVAPDTIVGSGDGAFIAALYAGNEPSDFADRFVSFWDELSALLRTEGSLRELLERYVDFDRINARGPVQLLLPVISLDEGYVHVISNVNGRWRQRVRAEHLVAASGYQITYHQPRSNAAPVALVAIPDAQRAVTSLRCLGETYRRVDLPVAFLVDLHMTGMADVKGALSLADRQEELAYEDEYRVRQLPSIAALVAGDFALTTEVHHLSDGTSKPVHSTGLGWLRNLNLATVDHLRGSGIRQINSAESQRRIQAGYDAVCDLVHDHRVMAGPALPPEVREFYTTHITIAWDSDEATFISIPHFLGLDEVDAIDPARRVHTADELAASIAAMIRGAVPDMQTLDVNALAFGIVFNSTVPLSRSPLKGWTLSAILGAGGSTFVEGLVSGGGSMNKVVIGTFGGSLLVIGMRAALTPLAGYLKGWRMATEKMGMQAGKRDAQRLFARLGWKLEMPAPKKRVRKVATTNSPPRKRAKRPPKDDAAPDDSDSNSGA